MTIAVVSWNTAPLLAGCLASLRADAETGVAEVWVHDNASVDGSVELVRDQFNWVNLIACPDNIGFGAAVNAVAARTSAAWLAPANADIELSPGALGALLDAGDRHPDAGALAPRLLLPDGSTQRSVYPFPTLPFALAYLSAATSISQRLSRHWCMAPGFDPDSPREVDWAVGAFLLVRRVAWDQAGGFDQAQWMYAEDLDLGWRLSRAGWRTRYVPAARVLHSESSATIRAWGDARHVRWHIATYVWLRRRRGTVYASTQAAAYVLGFLGRAAALGVIAIAGSGRARAAMHHALASARMHAVGLRGSLQTRQDD